MSGLAKLLGLAALALASTSASLVRAEAAPPLPLEQIEDGPLLPDFAFRELRADGTTRDWGFVELRGKPIVAVLWASWCGICTGEMPKLARLQSELGENVLVAALSIDEQGIEHAARTLARRRIAGLRIFHDSQRMLFASLGAYGVPTAVIANGDGRIVARATGRVPWNGAEVRAFLESLAGEAPAAPALRTERPAKHPSALSSAGRQHGGTPQLAVAQAP